MKGYRFNIVAMVLAILLATVAFDAFGMSKKAPKPEPVPPVVIEPVKPAEPAPAPSQDIEIPMPAELPAPLSGWPSEYDAFLKTEIAKYPALQTIKASAMKNLCPKFATVDKTKAFAAVIYGLALKESSYVRTSMYLEKTFEELDAVTGLPVISEGLLQMSYQDAKWYDGCKFDWKKDKDAHFADWKNRKGKQTWQSINPSKDTIDPYKNLACGVYLFDRLLKNPKFAGMNAEDILGRYWRAIRPNVFLPQIIAQTKKKMPECF